MIEAVVQRISEEGGAFSLVCSGGVDAEEFTAAMEWGQEAPDSPMAAAAAYGIGSSAAEAIELMLNDAGVK
jgi:hypothetical protein